MNERLLRLIARATQPMTAGRDAPLYHGTSLDSAVRILDSNTIRGGSDYQSEEDAFYRQKGVSLTRDKRFAETWRGMGVVFVLDQTKLDHDYKIRARDYFYNGFTKDKRSEREEFVPGDIKNLTKYLRKIYITPISLGKMLAHAIQERQEHHATKYLMMLSASPYFDPKQGEYIRSFLKNPQESTKEAFADIPKYGYITVGEFKYAMSYLIGDSAFITNEIYYRPDLSSNYSPRVYAKVDLHMMAQEGVIRFTNINTKTVGPVDSSLRLKPEYVGEVGLLGLLSGSGEGPVVTAFLQNEIVDSPYSREKIQELVAHPKFNPHQRNVIMQALNTQEEPTPVGIQAARVLGLVYRAWTKGD